MVTPTFKDAIEKFKNGYRGWCTNHISFKQICENQSRYLKSSVLLPGVTMAARTSHKEPGVPSERFITSVKLALVDNQKVYNALLKLDKPNILSANERTKLNLTQEDRDTIENAVSNLLPVDHYDRSVKNHLECELTVLRLELKDEGLRNFYQACFYLHKGLVKFFNF